MTKSPKRYDYKQRREVRRRNHIARDLWEPKYKARRVENKNKDDEDWRIEVDEWYDSNSDPYLSEPRNDD